MQHLFAIIIIAINFTLQLYVTPLVGMKAIVSVPATASVVGQDFWAPDALKVIIINFLVIVSAKSTTGADASVEAAYGLHACMGNDAKSRK